MEMNEFFTATSIHGFPYVSNSQTRPTRILWTIIVLFGFGFATYFLYETVLGFDDKYVTTTTVAKSVQEYPFPAVTFYPGEYNLKYAFLRNFLNKGSHKKLHI